MEVAISTPIYCFDLSFNTEVNSFLPSIYLLEGSYINKKLTIDTLANFAINWTELDIDLKTLFEIEKALKPEQLFLKYSSKKKKNISELINDASISKFIQSYIEKKIDNYLQLIQRHDFPISINLQNNKNYDKFRKSFGTSSLNPFLKFVKHENGMDYFLFLKENTNTYIPSQNNPILLTNEPSWIVLNDTIYAVEQINSNKIKPFITKEKIEIPPNLTTTYFEKFIKDIVKIVLIEAEGFKVEKRDKLLECKLNFVYDFFKDIYKIELHFVYENIIFKSTSTLKKKIGLNLEDLDNISVYEFTRNDASEKKFINYLLDLQLEYEQGLFYIQNQKKYDLVAFLTENKAYISSLGFDFSATQIDQKNINLDKATIDFSNEMINDWFDIKIKIKVGNFEISFIDIIENIKSENPFYLLPDETYFMIPDEWMSHFSTLQTFVTIKQNKIQLPKNKEGLLTIFQSNTLETKQEEKTYIPSSLVKATLRPYQIEGVSWLLKNYRNQTGACLADDMGLGKTLQILATLAAIQEDFVDFDTDSNFPLDLFSIKTMDKEPLKALIVLPNTLLFNWYNETQKFTPHFSKVIYSGKNRHEIAKRILNYDLIFTTYSILSKDVYYLKTLSFRAIVLDESQQIKNKNSKIFKAINQMNTAFKVSLSGTPIENSLSDLWSQMQFINPDILGNFAFFTKKFLVPIQKQKSDAALQTLLQIINPFLLRRTRKSVLNELPDLSEQIVYCEMQSEQKKWYESEKSKARNFLLDLKGEKANNVSILNTLMRLRQICNHPKMIEKESSLSSGKFEEVTHYLETIQKSNQKALIFSSFVTHLSIYTEWCKENSYRYSIITGEIKDRQQEVQKFQTDDTIHFFFISLKSGSTGLNLTAANYIFFLDPWWNPSTEEQAIARSYRMGQKNKVSVIRFVSTDSIEEKILALQKSKKELSSSVITEHSVQDEIITNISEILV